MIDRMVEEWCKIIAAPYDFTDGYNRNLAAKLVQWYYSGGILIG